MTATREASPASTFTSLTLTLGAAHSPAPLKRRSSRLYGEAAHSITLTNPAVPTIVLQYTSFRQITKDISDARVYGGIHFRFDQDAELVWAKLSAEQSTRTTCALCTVMTGTMMTGIMTE
jgi:hypothetical protein